MSTINTRSVFHVALDGVGLILQGAPERQAYQQEQAPLYNKRFGAGDRSYNDLSAWWYFVQTSWAAGFKDMVSWVDDAQYYYSTNIDTWSENGAIKLSRGLTAVKTFTSGEDIYSGAYGNVAGSSYKFVGTDDAASGIPIIYQNTTGSTWVDISSASFPTSQNIIAQIILRGGNLWAFTIGSGTPFVVAYWDGTTWVDASDEIGTLLSSSPLSSRCAVDVQGTLYVSVDNTVNNKWGLYKTAVTSPTVAGDWTEVFERLNQTGYPVDITYHAGNLYYLLSNGELHEYNIASAVNTKITTFSGSSISAISGNGGRLLFSFGGKLVITVPESEIWDYDTDNAVLRKIWSKDVNKDAINSVEAIGKLSFGGVTEGTQIRWSNLIYNGNYFHNDIKNLADDNFWYPIFTDTSGVIYGIGSGTQNVLESVTPSGAVYKGTADENLIVFNNFDLVSGVDKMAYSATVLFKPLATGQSIIVEYFLGELTSASSWTVLGTASATLDGTTVREKTFLFGVAVIFKKIWFRVKLAGGGTDTPTMTDIIMEYLPMPTQKKNWTLNINCADDVKRLDGALVATTGRELKGRLERAWWTKSILDYQDLDYATTLINGALNATDVTITCDDTADFPEQGRFRIDDEEITYTGKTPTTFTGCTRGARSTRATTHSDDAVLNNAYKVIITNLSTRVPIALEDRELEYVVGLSLREV
ncbi:MAG: hypothetical protein WD883_00005 [Candidatus Colwellbacteria bacterium]